MDTMLHELCHNVHTEHDTNFYALLEEVKADWEAVSSKGYQGEGFFSQGRTLGKGHVFYKPSLNISAADRKQVKLAADRRARGNQFMGPGRTLGGSQVENGTAIQGIPGGGGQRRGGNQVENKPVVFNMPGRRLGGNEAPARPPDPPMVEGLTNGPPAPLPAPPAGSDGYMPPYEWVDPNNGAVLGQYGGDNRTGGRRLGGEGINDVDPKQLAAIAAEQRALDQKRCGAKQRGSDMRRETEKSQREGKRTEAKDIGNVIDLNDLSLYDLDDIPEDITAVYQPPPGSPDPVFATKPTSGSGFTGIPFQSDWICKMCTFRNPPLFLTCKICETERDLKDMPEPNPIDLTAGDVNLSWECRLCTFKNENVSRVACEMCGTAK